MPDITSTSSNHVLLKQLEKNSHDLEDWLKLLLAEMRHTRLVVFEDDSGDDVEEIK